MSAPTLDLPPVRWAWWWVPPAGHDAAAADAWSEEVAELFAAWTADGVALLPPGLRDALGTRTVGDEVVAWLRTRTADLPPATYVAFGAAFLAPDRPRWAPVVAVVRVREPGADDTGYLLDVVGAAGRPDDARPPLVEYVTTDAGDGVRVAALARGAHGEASVRVDAALRLDATDARGPVDVVVSTRVAELPLFGLVGPGVDQLLHLVAADAGTITTAGDAPPPSTRRTP